MLVYLIGINVSVKTDEYPSLTFQNIREKSTKLHGQTDGQSKKVYSTTKFAVGRGGGGWGGEGLIKLTASVFL